MKQEEVLKLFEETGALLNGHFELRSGLHSNQFFQCAHLLQHPRVSGRLCEALVEKMKAELKDLEIDTVIAPAMGGITIGHEVARALDVRFIFVEKEENILKLRRFKINDGERFVIAEDVVTRGGRVQETIDINGVCGYRVFNGTGHTAKGCFMKYKFAITDSLFAGIQIPYIAFDKLEIRIAQEPGYVFSMACAEVIKTYYFIPVFQEILHHIGTDKPGAAGYEYFGVF